MTREEAQQEIERIRGEKRKGDSSDLRAALKLLAEELNSKETHFILELLQNAEDNEYADKQPELGISIVADNPTHTPSADGCLTVLNNEVGFKLENVRSLCSVGQSTKKERNQGYIGEKGIGFKSVFRVTDSPHIFSNGLQFRFQIPTETEGFGYILPHWVETVPQVVREGFTAILLPLQPGKMDVIAKQLSKIAPETVLFLKKLKRLRLGDARFISCDGSLPLVRLCSNDEESHYFVKSKSCEKPADIIEEKRQGINARDVTIAFPLKASTVCTGRIFAFLPTEFDSGLPFLVNADFILNFNRERVLEDRRWNQWLRDEISPAFVQAFLSVLNDQTWKTDACRFLPIKSDLTPGSDFFAPIIESINAQLKTKPCILTEDGTPDMPEKVVYPGQLARRVLIDAPQKRFTFSLLNRAWEPHWQKRLKPLGVESLKFAQVFEVCNDDEWLKTRKIEWWETLLELCAECDIKAETIGAFPILLCQDGNHRPIASGTFYNSKSQAKQPEIHSEWPPAHLLDAQLQERIEQKPKILAWLTKVGGLHPFSVQSYITSKLLDWMRAQTGERAADRVVAAGRFVAKHMQNCDEPTAQVLREQMPFVLNDGQILFPADRPGKELVTPECVESDSGWQWLFISEQDRKHFSILSDDYFEGCSDVESEQIRKLIALCDAIDYPDPAKRSIPGGQHDWECPRWLRELDLEHPPSNLKQKVAALERWIGRFKPEIFSRFLHCGTDAGIIVGSGEPKKSELGVALQNRPWANSTKGLVCPSSAFVHDPDFQEFLQDSIPYIESTLQKELLGKLGVRLRLSSMTLIDLLRQMRDCGKADEVLAVRIYQRLQTMEFSADVFRDESLVLLCSPILRWMNTKQVFWQDVGPVFDQNFGYASLTYEKDELHGFFTKKLNVAEQPAAQQFAEVWLKMVTDNNEGQKIIEARLDEILPKIAEAADVDVLPDWWLRFRRMTKVWTTSGQFVEPRTAFTPDDTFAETTFGQTARIAWVPEAHVPARVNRLLSKLSCRSIAAHMKSFPVISGTMKQIEVAQFLTPASKELLVCWICDTGEWAKRKQELELLLRTEEIEVPELIVEYWLDNTDVPKSHQRIPAYWAYNDRRLYLQSGATAKAHQAAVAATIAQQFFRNSKQATDTVYRLLGLETADAVREKAERKWTLTSQQKEWLHALGMQMTVLDVVPNKPKPNQREPRPATGSVAPASPQLKTAASTELVSGQQQPANVENQRADNLKTEASGSAIITTDSQTQTQPPANPSDGQKSNGNEFQTSEDEDADFNQPLKPADTGVDFIHVAAHTRSLPKSERSRQNQTNNRAEVKNPLTRVSPKSKAELEERAVQIVRHQFQKLPELKEFNLTDRRKDSCGYDLHAAKPGRVLRIEIKAHAREAKSVFVTKREWDESRHRNRLAADDKWELWNVENIAGEIGNVQITRYFDLPEEARSREVGYWVDLNACQSELK